MSSGLQRFFIFDAGACFGCMGCVAACARVNGCTVGLFWRRVHKLPPQEGRFRTLYLSVSCNHCEFPPCVRGCPARALSKREQDGVVVHDAKKCLGCRYCQMACPYDAIKWDESAGVVSKCHFCHERLAEGLEPACVETCFAGALTQEVGTAVEMAEKYQLESPGLVVLAGVAPGIRFKKPKGNFGEEG